MAEINSAVERLSGNQDLWISELFVCFRISSFSRSTALEFDEFRRID